MLGDVINLNSWQVSKVTLKTCGCAITAMSQLQKRNEPNAARLAREAGISS